MTEKEKLDKIDEVCGKLAIVYDFAARMAAQEKSDALTQVFASQVTAYETIGSMIEDEAILQQVFKEVDEAYKAAVNRMKIDNSARKGDQA